ncbi:MAG TPA: DinB family protein [Pseudonocardiaceae bacterium]
MPTEDTERADIIADLAVARANLIKTTDGLTDEQAATRPTVSALCLGGLIKHVAAGEENWLRFIVEGPSALSFELPEGVSWAEIMAGTAREYPQWMIDHQNQFTMAPGETLAELVTHYEQVAAHTEEVIAALPDLSERREMPSAPWDDQPRSVQSVRRILTHVIVETAQHTGHAEIIRETLDNQ